jgi:hypothetical protein
MDVSPSRSFQGHTGPVHDLCQISIGKFQLILTGSSDLSVRVCFKMWVFVFKEEFEILVMGYCYRKMSMHIFIS